jgi:hypothetical protein
MTYAEWRALYQVTHGHCPKHCEHPQPLGIEDVVTGRDLLVCGACFAQGVLCEMRPCTPSLCDES